MPASKPAAWTLVEPCELHWRCWDGQYVVFNSASGDTHLLHFAAGEALKLIEQSPSDASKVCAQLADRLETPPGAELSAQVDRLLRELAELGLIEARRS